MKHTEESLKLIIKEAEEALKQLRSKKPQMGKTVTILYADGTIADSEYNTYLEGHFLTGNVFENRLMAEKEKEARLVFQELRMCEGVKKFVVGEPNWGIRTTSLGDQLYLYGWKEDMSGVGQIYFESERLCQQAVDCVGQKRIIDAVNWLAKGC